MAESRFTGERLHEDDALFGVDLARHRAAYDYARGVLGPGRVLDLGCGTGYGAASLAAEGRFVVGVDRATPSASSRVSGTGYVRADLRRLPFRPRSFGAIVSFQVIEHLVDPSPYLEAMAGALHEDGVALVSTPNVLRSDSVNPFHVHEYTAAELTACLGRYFGEVEMLGVGMTPRVREHMAARSRRIQRIVRLDPLRLRDRLPQALVTWLFALFARLVRRQAGAADDVPDVSPSDFPVGPPSDDCIDLLALCRRPRC